MPTMSNLLPPDLASYLKSLYEKPVDHSADLLISMLKHRQIKSSRACAVAAAHLFLQIVEKCELERLSEFVEHIIDIGRRLCSGQPREYVVGNIVRRVLGLLAEANETTRSYDDTSNNGRAGSTDFSMRFLKEDVLNGLHELLDELDQADEQISSYALDYVGSAETILTYTSSLTVQKFLLSIVKKRKFSVMHVEGYPNEIASTYDTTLYGKHKALAAEDMANKKHPQQRFKSLSAYGIDVTMVPDAAAFAVMPRVTKVLLSAEIVLPNGGILAAAGSKAIVFAARAHRTQVVVLSPIYKLMPWYPVSPCDMLGPGDPSKVVDFSESDYVEKISVNNPTHDFIPPSLIDTFITNLGAIDPKYMYRIAAEHYRIEDYNLWASLHSRRAL